MADEAHEERFRQHEAMLEGLARILAGQHATNQRQDDINERLTLAIERIDRTLAHVEITQARVETLLARMIGRTEQRYVKFHSYQHTDEMKPKNAMKTSK